MGDQGYRTGQPPKVVARAASHGSTPSEHSRRVEAAWEQFASGDDDVQGVPSSVLLSWYRCRDLYRVDPHQASAPRAAARGHSDILHNSVFAQLGGIAAALADRTADCLSTVTDGDGQILAMWGSGDTMRRAEENNLAPFFTWSEEAIGTNGMGTALSQDRAMSIRGPEHWCAALHDWYCTGVAIYDSVTREPVATLNVSSWEHEVPVNPKLLTERTEIVRQDLRNRAVRNATEVTCKFVETDRRSKGALLAIDVAGGLLAANEQAQGFLNGVRRARVGELLSCKQESRMELRDIARKAAQRARKEPEWVGAADLGSLVGNRSQVFSITPVRAADGVVGLLLSDEQLEGGIERLDEAPAQPEMVDLPRRIPALHGERIILLAPEEIRYAVAERHNVWLITDRGRVRAAIHGIDNVERELAPFGFMRVHRSYIVNLSRVREISERGNGALTLSTDPQRQEAIAVSRRCAIKLRRQFRF